MACNCNGKKSRRTLPTFNANSTAPEPGPEPTPRNTIGATSVTFDGKTIRFGSKLERDAFIARARRQRRR